MDLWFGQVSHIYHTRAITCDAKSFFSNYDTLTFRLVTVIIKQSR